MAHSSLAFWNAAALRKFLPGCCVNNCRRMRGRLRHCRAIDRMRIVAGAWRGRTLVAPPGQGTRPTADRVRQALFDMLMHAEWGGHAVINDAVVLDVFAGTGALGLEALS